MVAAGSAARMMRPITATAAAPPSRHARSLPWSVIPPSAMIGIGLRRALSASFSRPSAGKKLANHEAAVALHFMHYNFVRIHQTLRVTPAMAAGVTDRLWSVEDIAALVEAAVPKPGSRGLYKKLATT